MTKLDSYSEVWRTKPVLRAVYNSLYQKVAVHVRPGPTLEIGSGIGNLNLPENKITRLDIQVSDEVDIVGDAHALPLDDNTFDNIILFDVLHHLDCPLIFFAEAHRVLKLGGRIIMVEPAITPISYPFYHLLHEERVDMSWKPDPQCIPNLTKDPYDSNQAIPTLLFGKYKNSFGPDLGLPFTIKIKEYLSLFVYPLSGGFKRWNLIPALLVKPLLKIDDILAFFLGRVFGFRLLVVLEKED